MATTGKSVELTIEGRVARVVLSREARRNSFDTAMLEEFEDTIVALGRARGVEIAVLTGKGPSFCAGTDLKQLEHLTADDTLHWQRRTGEMVERWTRLPLTTLTAFNGPAIGSGAVLGLASDLRIAADTTWFTLPEVAFGIPLTWSGVPVLTAMLGADRVKRALLLRERIEAKEMLSLDLVMSVVEPVELGTETERVLRLLLESPHLGRMMAKGATTAAAAVPGFSTNLYEPYLAAYGVATRPAGGYDFSKKDGK